MENFDEVGLPPADSQLLPELFVFEINIGVWYCSRCCLPAISPPAKACQGSIPNDIIYRYLEKTASLSVRLMAGRPNTVFE